MDSGLVSNVLRDRQLDSQAALLQNLPDRSLTLDQYHAVRNEREADTVQREIPAANAMAGSHTQSGAVISKIEDIFESIADSILNQKQDLSILLKTRQRPGNQNTRTQNASTKGQYEVRYPSRSPQEAWKFGEFITCTIVDHAQNHSRLTQNPRAFTRSLGYGRRYYKKVLGAISFFKSYLPSSWFYFISHFQTFQRFQSFILLFSNYSCDTICGLRLTIVYRDIYYRDPELFMKQAVVDRYVGDLAYTLGVERDALNVASLHDHPGTYKFSFDS